jgi:polar amino acid transport system substrate-binding protein
MTYCCAHAKLLLSRALLLLACVLQVFALKAGAQSLPTCPPDPIRVSFLEFGLHFYQTRGGTGAGIDADLIAEMAARTGCKFDTSIQTRARAWMELSANNIDVMTSTLRTPDRDALGWFIPYMRSRHMVLVSPSAQPLQTLAQFQENRKLRFGMVRGYRHTPFYDELIAGWARQGRVSEYIDEASLLNALKHGDIAAVLSQPIVYRRYLNEDDLKTIHISDWDPGSPGIIGNLLLSKHAFSEADAGKWRNLVGSIQQDGTLRRIFEKYMSPEDARGHLPQ